MLLQRMIPFCMVVGISLTLIGCGGGGPQMAPVTGTVTFNDKPIGKINVMFVPEGKGMIAQGTSDDNGKFTLTTLESGDGAMMGNYKIAFKYIPEIVPDMPGFTGGVKSEPSPIPLKYVDESKSGFTATVEASKNDFKFDLK